MKRVLVLGGSGVFGARVVEELRARGREVEAPRGREVDVTRPETLRAALARDGMAVVACCAGPFSMVDPRCVTAAMDAGADWVDLADDRRFCESVRALDGELRARGRTAVYGASSLPGISGALAVVARGARPDPPSSARAVLFIGNKNPKGRAAVRSAASSLGRSIGKVDLPRPFGRVRAFAFDAPDHDLLPSLVGAPRVTVGVGFELPGVAGVLGLLGPRAAGFLGNLASGVGHTGGAIVVELAWDDGVKSRATLFAASDGQRAASLPVVLAVERLLEGGAPPGACTIYELLGARPFLDALVASGFQLLTS